MKVAAIAAMSENRVIGKDNKLPWSLPEDLKRFSALTSGCPVIMGRKTFDSLPPKSKPLPNRTNLVVTRNKDWIANNSSSPKVECFTDLSHALTRGKELATERLWIIGGEDIYRQTLKDCDEVFLTLVKTEIEGDAFFPEFEADFEVVEIEERENFNFIRYARK